MKNETDSINDNYKAITEIMYTLPTKISPANNSWKML